MDREGAWESSRPEYLSSATCHGPVWSYTGYLTSLIPFPIQENGIKPCRVLREEEWKICFDFTRITLAETDQIIWIRERVLWGGSSCLAERCWELWQWQGSPKSPSQPPNYICIRQGPTDFSITWGGSQDVWKQVRGMRGKILFSESLKGLKELQIEKSSESM